MDLLSLTCASVFVCGGMCVTLRLQELEEKRKAASAEYYKAKKEAVVKRAKAEQSVLASNSDIAAVLAPVSYSVPAEE